jgi:hypothetical protein
MKVAKHFIGAPATNEANNVGINASAEEGHGTTSTKAASRDTAGVNTKGEVKGGGAVTEHRGDAGGGNGGEFARRKKTEIKRCSRGSQVLSKMQNTAGESKHRAGGGVASTSMANFFTPNGILLVGEDKIGKGGMLDVDEGCHRSIEDAKADGEFDIAEAKRSAERIGGGGESVFAGTVKVKEGNIGHVDDGMREWRGGEKSEGMRVVD